MCISYFGNGLFRFHGVSALWLKKSLQSLSLHSCDINLFCDKELLGGMITFSDSSSYIVAASAPIHTFLEVVLTSTQHKILSSLWFLSHITAVGTMDKGKRRMNPTTMTVDRISDLHFSSLVHYRLSNTVSDNTSIAWTPTSNNLQCWVKIRL